MPELSLNPKENWTKSGIARVLGLFLRLKLGLNFSIHGQSLSPLPIYQLPIYLYSFWKET